jgi:putative SOS response-associated peptidase YedK
MCGRFALATEKHILEILYQLEIREDLQLRYNIAPSQNILACRLSPQHGRRELAALKWGLVPFWAEDETIGSRMINARSETVAEKPSFRDAFKKRRLLIPVSGFYEWKKEDGAKQPFYISRKDGQPFSLAGLWERWDKGTNPLESCTILTTEPNLLLAPLHNRMPVVVPLKTTNYGSIRKPTAKPFRNCLFLTRRTSLFFIPFLASSTAPLTKALS